MWAFFANFQKNCPNYAHNGRKYAQSGHPANKQQVQIMQSSLFISIFFTANLEQVATCWVTWAQIKASSGTKMLSLQLHHKTEELEWSTGLLENGRRLIAWHLWGQLSRNEFVRYQKLLEHSENSDDSCLIKIFWTFIKLEQTHWKCDLSYKEQHCNV
jgi:hypothetical protein